MGPPSYSMLVGLWTPWKLGRSPNVSPDEHCDFDPCRLGMWWGCVRRLTQTESFLNFGANRNMPSNDHETTINTRVCGSKIWVRLTGICFSPKPSHFGDQESLIQPHSFVWLWTNLGHCCIFQPIQISQPLALLSTWSQLSLALEFSHSHISSKLAIEWGPHPV